MIDPIHNENIDRLSKIVEHAIGRLRTASVETTAPQSATGETMPCEQAAVVAVLDPPVEPCPQPQPPREIKRIEKFDFAQECAFAPTGNLGRRFRELSNNICGITTSNNASIYVFTSCNHSEGKTHSAINVARFAARREGRKVLLMDCDLRRPSIHKQIRFDFECGLDDVLAGKCVLEEALVYSEADNLTVLPALLGRSGATELLESEKMGALLMQVRSEYDFVFIDCSPTLSTTDPLVIGAEADGVILTVKAGAVHHEAAARACETLRKADAHIAGIILTQTRS